MNAVFLVISGFFFGFGISTFVYKREIANAFSEREEMRLLLLQTAQEWRDLLNFIKRENVSIQMLRIIAENIDDKIKKGTK